MFLTAAIGKSFDYQKLLDGISRLSVPLPTTAPLAAVLLALEFITALLVLSGRGVRVGATIGGLLATAFTVVTGAKLIQGTSSKCSCFGVFLSLPPQVTLGIDALLFSACLGLLCLHSGARATAEDARPSANSTPFPWGFVSYGRRGAVPLPFLVSAYLMTMGLSLHLGYDYHKRRAQAVEQRALVLRHGDQAPYFRVRTDRGTYVSTASLEGKWALIMFVQARCDPCTRELRDVAAQYSAWKSRMDVLVVLSGRPLFSSPDAAARRFARELRLPMPVVADADGALWEKYCDRPARTPFSVLLDDHGVVRFIQDGREEGEFRLVSDIETVLNDTPYDPRAVYLRNAFYGQPAPDGELEIGDKRVRLSTLWRDKPLLLAFLLQDCGSCQRHLVFLERALGRSSAVVPVYVYPSRRQAIAAAQSVRLRGRVAVDYKGKVHTAFQVWNAPSTFLIRNGRLIHASGPRSTTVELARLLRKEQPRPSIAVPLVERASDNSRSGKEVTK